MSFWLNEILRYFKKKDGTKIGYILPNIGLYNRISPSSRIRVFDIINSFRNDNEYDVYLYNPYQNYELLVFQKKFDSRAYELAIKNKNKGTKIILDINVNYYDTKANSILMQQHSDILKFTNICDAIITSSSYLTNYINNLFPKKNIYTIFESIHEKYFVKRKIISRNIKTLIWSGYSVKADCFLLIKDILETIYCKYKFKLLIVSEKKPKLKIGNVPIEYIRYSEKNIVNILLQGDIFIAPRNLDDSYNMGHSFTKIGVAMALGIPVIASPVFSYLESPAIISNTEEEWMNNLCDIFENNINLHELSERGIKYCKEYYSIDVIKAKYKFLFNKMNK